jgi:putative flippase GtrA
MILNTQRQLLRYAVVGIGSNVILYLAYLLLTGLGLGHKTAMTVLYLVGILQTFLLNRYWTFADQGKFRGALIRYVIVYLLGYLVNFSGLYIFVDVMGFAHQLIQAVMIFVVAALQFLLQRLWVFKRANEIPGYVPRQGNP